MVIVKSSEAKGSCYVETKGLDDMDIEELDKMVDKRPAPFWKKSWGEVFLNIIIWAIVVYINECNYLNPHDPNFIFADYSIPPPPQWLVDKFVGNSS